MVERPKVGQAFLPVLFAIRNRLALKHPAGLTGFWASWVHHFPPIV